MPPKRPRSNVDSANRQQLMQLTCQTVPFGPVQTVCDQTPIDLPPKAIERLQDMTPERQERFLQNNQRFQTFAADSSKHGFGKIYKRGTD